VDEQPERGALLPLRRRYSTFANFRPVYLPPELAHFSPLKPHVVAGGIDMMMIRELVGGLYFGKKEGGINAAGKRYVDEHLEYDEDQIRAILVVAFDEAMGRKKVLHNVHKSNVLKSSVLWNEILDEVAPDYPEVEVKHIIVDSAATALVLNPRQFDVMVMENMFGDIISDQTSALVGGMGMAPSGDIGDRHALFQPCHGSAPDIAGQGRANPTATILSAAMMLDWLAERHGDARLARAAAALEEAVDRVFGEGRVRPFEFGGTDGTRQIAAEVAGLL
jgi:3-isopropylmalate dehydrogenase